MPLDTNAFARGMASVPQIDITAGPRQQTANLMNMMKVQALGQEMQDKQALRNAMSGIDWDKGLTNADIGRVLAADPRVGAQLQATQQSITEARAKADERESAFRGGVALATYGNPDDASLDRAEAILATKFPPVAAKAAIDPIRALKTPEERQSAILQMAASEPTMLKAIFDQFHLTAADLARLKSDAADRSLRAQGMQQEQARFKVTSDQKATELEQNRARLEIQTAAEKRAQEEADREAGRTTLTGQPAAVEKDLLKDKPAAETALQNFQRERQEKIDLIDRYLDMGGPEATSGPLKGRLPSVTPGATNADTLLDQIKDSATLLSLMNTKGVSGSNLFGQLAIREGEIAGNAFTALSRLQSPDAQRAELKRLKQKLIDMEQIMSDHYARTYGVFDRKAPAAPQGNFSPAPKGVDPNVWSRLSKEEQDAFMGGGRK